MNPLIIVDCVALLALLVETIVLAASKSLYSGLRRLSIALFGGSNLFSLVGLMYLCDIGGTHEPWVHLSIAGAACIFLVLDVALFRRLRSAEEKDSLALRNVFLEEQVLGQKAQAERLCGIRAEAKGIADDLYGQLEAIECFIEHHETGRVTQGLDRLEASTYSKTPALCDNATVNSLMVFKMQVCRSEGIDLRAALFVPSSIGLSSVELCAVFANIIDNAIAACIEAKRVEARPVIIIEAHCRGGYLIVDARNTCLMGQDDQGERQREGEGAFCDGELPHHGWGLSILRNIAARNDGRLVARREGALFHTSMALHLPAENEPLWACDLTKQAAVTVEDAGLQGA